MSSRAIVNLILLLCLLGLIYASLNPSFFTSHSDKDKPQAANTPITSLKPTDINKIEIENASGTTRLSLHATEWQLDAPVTLKANQYNVQQLLNITQTNSRAHYPADPQKLMEFGLSEPLVRIKLNQTELRFGNTDPIQQSRYLASGDTIYLIADEVSYLLMHAPGSFMDTSIVPGQPEIDTLLLPSFTLRLQDGTWRLQPIVDNNHVTHSAQKDSSAALPAMQSLKLSQDDLVRYVDEWRYAQALKVEIIQPATKLQNQPLQRVELQLADGHKLLLFAKLHNEEAVLQNPELGIQYIVTNDKFNQLLSLPKPESAATETEDDPNVVQDAAQDSDRAATANSSTLPETSPADDSAARIDEPTR